MTLLVPIHSADFGAETLPTVNARELHAFLRVGRDFPTWIKGRLEQYGFVAGQDYVTAVGLRSPNLASSKSRPQQTIDYHLTLDVAKELSMLENNEQGRLARRYFIEAEKRLKAKPQGAETSLQLPPTLTITQIETLMQRVFATPVVMSGEDYVRLSTAAGKPPFPWGEPQSQTTAPIPSPARRGRRTPESEERARQALDLLRDGRSVTDIAAQLGMDRSSVYRAIGRADAAKGAQS